jgi:hypothetical protein
MHKELNEMLLEDNEIGGKGLHENAGLFFNLLMNEIRYGIIGKSFLYLQ